MKKFIHISGLILLIISGISCSDDFLSKNEVTMYALHDTLKLNNSQTSVSMSVRLPSDVDCEYTIYYQPKWLSFNNMHGPITNGSLTLDFNIIKNEIIAGYQTHYANLVLDVEDIGMILIIVSYENYGSPTLQCSAASLNYESLSTKALTITNTTEGILIWEITGKPDWLNISPSSGTLAKDQWVNIMASLNPDLLNLEQETTGNFVINSNSITGNLTIQVHVAAMAVNPPDIQHIYGIVTDAEYNHESGIMVICTRSPNKMIVFNTKTNETDSLLLPKTPNCISLSEDGHKAVTGYSVSSVSYIDIDNLEVIKDYTIDCVPFDIVLGDNGWCYIIPTIEQWTYLRNLNLISGELILASIQGNLYEKTIIKKIYGKPYMVGTRTTLSPSGLLIFDLTKGKANDTTSYYHTSIDKFWISRDGTKLFTTSRIVYNLPDYDGQFHPNNPTVFGQIETTLPYITAFDECPDSNSIFISSHYYFNPGYSPVIEQYNSTNLNKTRTFSLSPVYLTENGIKKLYETSAMYIFVTRSGSYLYAIKNIRQDYDKNYWTIEKFSLGGSR